MAWLRAFDDSERVQVHARRAQLVAAALEALFNGAADTDQFSTCSLHDFTQTAQRFAARKKIIDHKHAVAGMDPLLGDKQRDLFLVSIGKISLWYRPPSMLSLLAFFA